MSFELIFFWAAVRVRLSRRRALIWPAAVTSIATSLWRPPPR